MNGGTCIDGIDNFTCSCPNGLIGLFCECLLLENGDMDCNYTAPETSSIMYTTDIEWDTTSSLQYTTTKSSIPIDDKFYTNVPNVTTADISSTITIQIPTTQMSIDTSETSTQFNTLFTTTISNAFYTSLATLSTMFTDAQSSSSSSSTISIDPTIPTQSTTTTETEQLTTNTDSISISKIPFTIEPKEILPPIDYTTTTISSSDLITTATSASMSTTLTPYFTDNPQSTITKTISSQIPLSTTMGTSISTADDGISSSTTTADTTISPTWQTVTTSTTTETLDTTTTMSHTDSFTGMPDCTKIPCFNGGTCAKTSEGAKVSLFKNKKKLNPKLKFIYTDINV